MMVRRDPVPKKIKKPRSLDRFYSDEKATTCKICALPAPVTKQIAKRDRHIVTLDLIIEWLWKEYGAKLTKKEIHAHCREKGRGRR